MLRANILVVFIAIVNAAPSPYYSLVESPTSRFEQHFFTTPQQQQPIQAQLQERMLPLSTRHEYPNQHVGYYYSNLHMQNNQHNMNHHQLNMNHHQLKHESLKEQNYRVEQRFRSDQQKIFGSEEQKMLESEQQKILESEEQKMLESEEQKLLEIEQEKILESEEQKQILENEEQKRILEREEQKILEIEQQKILEIEQQKILESEKQKMLEIEEHKQILENEEQKRISEREEQKMLEIEQQKILENEEQTRIGAEVHHRVEVEQQRIELEEQSIESEEQFEAIKNVEQEKELESFSEALFGEKLKAPELELEKILPTTMKSIEPQMINKPEAFTIKQQLKNEPINNNSPKDDAESVEIRADSNPKNQPIPEMFSMNEGGFFQNTHYMNSQMPQPLLHRLYSFNDQFYVATAPEFYGYFHPVHNPTAPIFSLQELQPIVQKTDNIEIKSKKIADSPMPSSSTPRSSRAHQGYEENKKGEVDSMHTQFPPSKLRIVVDEDETEEIEEDKSELTEINTRSKLPSDNQSSGESNEEVKLSRKDNKQEQLSAAEGRGISDESSVAQAKPSGTAVAGDGGVASSKPVATAVSGRNGLSVASPSATAVAGSFAFDDEDRKMKKKPGQTISAAAQAYRKTIDFKDFL